MENNENNITAEQQSQTNNFCTGNCLNCSFQQQVYCAAQHGHAIMNTMPNLFAHLEMIEKAVNKISGGMLQMTDKPFINPLEGDKSSDGTDTDKDIVSKK